MAARGAAADTASNANGYDEQHARRTSTTLSDVVVVGRQLSLVAVYVHQWCAVGTDEHPLLGNEVDSDRGSEVRRRWKPKKRRKCEANKTTIEATERGVEYESSRDTDVDGTGRRPRGKDPALVFAVVAVARHFSLWPPPTLVALSTTAAVLYCYRRSSSSTATAALRRGHRRRYHDYCRFALFTTILVAAHYKPRGGPLSTSWRLRRPPRCLLFSGPSPFSFVAATAFHHAPRQQPPRPTMKSPNKG
ncbi:hypothetical protein RP20_CCG009150 [Aedes albopictus]|nr:hypothetical protein RP20_CCG009150 [Aedes albopictus]